MKSMYDCCREYAEHGLYPFHMPGHKRNPAFKAWGLSMEMDFTEIDGLDNLHYPEGIILEAEERMARLYGVKRSYFLVGGSTCGILAAVSACVPARGRIAMGRNCHKSVYHAVELKDLTPSYLYPDEKGIINGDIKADAVNNMLKLYPDIKAVIITSPSYDGVISDIRSITRIVHEAGAVLIVDEAHGAHLKFSSYFPSSSVDEGADLVIQSFHKTLPALTQAAVLHVCSDRVDLFRLERFLDIYQTSSPSYLIMASIDRCVEFLEKEGRQAFERYICLLEDCRRKLSENQSIRLYEPDPDLFAYDRSKILLIPQIEGMTGVLFADILRKKYGLETEMALRDYCLCLTSVGDSQQGFESLARAVEDIGKRKSDYISDGFEKKEEIVLPVPEMVMNPSQAAEVSWEKIALAESTGRISVEYIYLYPPGIPLVVPGERMTGQLIENMRRYKREGLSLQGMSDHSGNTVRVMIEPCLIPQRGREERVSWEKSFI